MTHWLSFIYSLSLSLSSTEYSIIISIITFMDLLISFDCHSLSTLQIIIRIIIDFTSPLKTKIQVSIIIIISNRIFNGVNLFHAEQRNVAHACERLMVSRQRIFPSMMNKSNNNLFLIIYLKRFMISLPTKRHIYKTFVVFIVVVDA